MVHLTELQTSGYSSQCCLDNMIAGAGMLEAAHGATAQLHMLIQTHDMNKQRTHFDSTKRLELLSCKCLGGEHTRCTRCLCSFVVLLCLLFRRRAAQHCCCCLAQHSSEGVDVSINCLCKPQTPQLSNFLAQSLRQRYQSFT